MTFYRVAPPLDKQDLNRFCMGQTPFLKLSFFLSVCQVWSLCAAGDELKIGSVIRCYVNFSLNL